ncbi:MAG: cysteine--tRNA ligase [Bacteroidales bacterium]
MENKLFIHNTLSRKKELFEPINPPFAGMYVCGPTVYGDPHLGHARAAITFDLVFRHLLHLGYKVRYVRNITDVGHLVADLDEGEDKIAVKARLEQVEPMEIAQYYADRYFLFMDALSVKRPSIEPRASGHMIEQILMVEKILEAGYAYEVNGSVYFDVEKYSKSYEYGKLSGRVLEDLLTNTRVLEGQDEKRNSADFALWKKAQPEHIMRWPSPWGEGFPGWHLECSAMSTKYLGEFFDIHGGGMDLLFPHHESEIAQCQAAIGHESVKYWMHNNMITINGQKMGKSLGNFITLDEFFTGKHAALQQAYSPMTIRFFILQAHYRSTLDFSNEALQAADKGLKKLLAGYETLLKMLEKEGGPLPRPLPQGGGESVSQAILQEADIRIKNIETACYSAMNDDFNSPMAIAGLFEAVRVINSASDKTESLTLPDMLLLKKIYDSFLFDILGMKSEKSTDQGEVLDGLMQLILAIRQKSRETKDWGTSDQIRDALQKLQITVKDGKEGSKWNIEY